MVAGRSVARATPLSHHSFLKSGGGFWMGGVRASHEEPTRFTRMRRIALATSPPHKVKVCVHASRRELLFSCLTLRLFTPPSPLPPPQSPGTSWPLGDTLAPPAPNTHTDTAAYGLGRGMPHCKQRLALFMSSCTAFPYPVTHTSVHSLSNPPTHRTGVFCRYYSSLGEQQQIQRVGPPPSTYSPQHHPKR